MCSLSIMIVCLLENCHYLKKVNSRANNLQEEQVSWAVVMNDISGKAGGKKILWFTFYQ